MAMPTDIPASQAPSYIIYRDVPAGQLYDPTAPLAFFPPKDSDELFDALRAKYPHLKSHSERMRDATIEFLLEERHAESLSATVSPAMPSLYDSMADTSPWQQSWPSASMTTLSSPDMTNLATPAFGDSPKPQIPQLARQQSYAATPSETQTPAIDQMTSVFSLSTSEQPKQRVRRKMTEAEKVEYRKRRIVKACEKCSKRKRKCIHNQPEMEGLKNSNDKATCKVTKPRTNSGKAPQRAEASFPSFDFSTTDPSDIFTADGILGGYEDFTLMFDSAPDFSFDETPTFDMSQNFTPVDNFRQCTQNFEADNAKPTWHQNHMQDWTVLGSNVAESFSSYAESTQAADNITGLLFPHSSQMYDGAQSRRRCDLGSSQSGSLQTSSTRSAATDQLDDRFQRTPSSSVGGSPGGVSLPQAPTHTAHVHEMQAQQDSCHVNDIHVGEYCATDSRKISHGSASLEGVMSSGQSLDDTALRRSTRTTVGANRSAANDGPQSTDLRHRLRSARVIDPALQSELSSTSAISSSSVSRMENAPALEGRPAESGVPSSSQSSLGGAASSRIVASDPARMKPTPLTRNSPTQGETALRPSRLILAADRSPIVLQPQPTRASSALLAQPSPFDSIDSAPARSTELFRLRHRISASLDSTAPMSLHTTSSSSLSIEANGGSRTVNATGSLAGSALQLQTHTTPSLAISVARGEGANATDFNGARKIFTEVETNREKDHHGRANTLFTESETVRYRDHHGLPATTKTGSNKLRQALCTMVAFVALGAMLLLASSSLHPSMLVLALLAPASMNPHNGSWLSTARSKAQSAFTSKQRKSRAAPLSSHTFLSGICT